MPIFFLLCDLISNITLNKEEGMLIYDDHLKSGIASQKNAFKLMESMKMKELIDNSKLLSYYKRKGGSACHYFSVLLFRLSSLLWRRLSIFKEINTLSLCLV